MFTVVRAAAQAAPLKAINLGTAGGFTILAKSGISTVPFSAISEPFLMMFEMSYRIFFQPETLVLALRPGHHSPDSPSSKRQAALLPPPTK